MKYKFLNIDSNNLSLLIDFIQNLGLASLSFRYFDKRSLESLNNHVATLGMIYKNRMISYGHLDKENEIVWLGIAVLPEYQGKGIGKAMMKALLEKSEDFGLTEIFLTVDKENISAIKLYQQHKFLTIEEGVASLKMRYFADTL